MFSVILHYVGEHLITDYRFDLAYGFFYQNCARLILRKEREGIGRKGEASGRERKGSSLSYFYQHLEMFFGGAHTIGHLLVFF